MPKGNSRETEGSTKHPLPLFSLENSGNAKTKVLGGAGGDPPFPFRLPEKYVQDRTAFVWDPLVIEGGVEERVEVLKERNKK